MKWFIAVAFYMCDIIWVDTMSYLPAGKKHWTESTFLPTILCPITADCNNVFRSTLKKKQQHSDNFVFFYSLNLLFPYCCQGNVFDLCDQRAPSNIKPKLRICAHTHQYFNIITDMLIIRHSLTCSRMWDCIWNTLTLTVNALISSVQKIHIYTGFRGKYSW